MRKNPKTQYCLKNQDFGFQLIFRIEDRFTHTQLKCKEEQEVTITINRFLTMIKSWSMLNIFCRLLDQMQ